MKKLVGAVAVVGVLLAGCGSVPGKVGAAAIVGNTTVPLDQFQQQINTVIATKPAARQAMQQRKLNQATMGLLTIRVQHELVSQLSGQLRLASDPALINKTLQSPQLDQYLQNQVFDRAGFAQYLDDRTKLADLARKQAGGLQLTIDSTVVADPAKAKELAQQVAAHPAQTQQLMSAGGAKVGINQTISPLQDVQTAVSSPLFGANPGTVIAFPIGGQSTQWLVARVLDRKQVQTLAPSQLLDQIGPDSLAQLGQHLLTPYAQRIGVSVNPRYGVWDNLGLAIVPSEGEKSAVSYPIATKQ